MCQRQQMPPTGINPVVDNARSHLRAEIEGSAHNALDAAIPEDRFFRPALQITRKRHSSVERTGLQKFAVIKVLRRRREIDPATCGRRARFLLAWWLLAGSIAPHAIRQAYSSIAKAWASTSGFRNGLFRRRLPFAMRARLGGSRGSPAPALMHGSPGR
jgi:hypothetical protein